MIHEIDDAEAPLLHALERSTGTPCADCAAAICGHEVLFSVALGFQDSPRCLACLAKGLARTDVELREQLWQHTQRRECYRNAWRAAGEREGSSDLLHPGCLWRGENITFSDRIDPTMVTAIPAGIAAEWDAGDMGCGELVMALRGRLNAIQPGEWLKVIALDPAAPEDIPAWCRLTGNRLAWFQHPAYHIERKRG
jgi:tRNA 2-thiouridine synthesizing protein A